MNMLVSASAVAAAPAIAAPSIAPTGVDPIFTAIADHRSAMVAWLMALKIEGDAEDQEPPTDWDAFHAKNDAEESLIGITPTTRAGAIALLQHADDLCAHRVAVPGCERSHFCEIGLLGQEYADDDVLCAQRDVPLNLPFLYWIMRNARAGLEAAPI